MKHRAVKLVDAILPTGSLSASQSHLIQDILQNNSTLAASTATGESVLPLGWKPLNGPGWTQIFHEGFVCD